MNIISKIKEGFTKPIVEEVGKDTQSTLGNNKMLNHNNTQLLPNSLIDYQFNGGAGGAGWSVDGPSSTVDAEEVVIGSTVDAEEVVIGSTLEKTRVNAEVTILGKIRIKTEIKVPNKLVQWVHKKFFGTTWKDVSCAKCPSKLPCLVNKSFERDCKIK